MSALIKPMLAAKLGPAKLEDLDCYPYLASPKVDGVRCVVQGGVAYSRNLKPIRNTYVQRCLSKLEGLRPPRQLIFLW